MFLKKLNSLEKSSSVLGLIIVFFIGKYFYQLADEYDKTKWLFAILGIAVYYTGSILIGGIIIGLGGYFLFDYDIESTNDLALGIMLMPFGILTCYVVYGLLEKKWKRQEKLQSVSIDDIGKD